ncbi:hypothetical protein ACFFTM_01845 [Pseudoduganella plicata]|uniref:Peptide ABC transporter permease n=1 Tax=Pseudoduganella plicata TaxID=321984 RepID=A0A4P7BGQ0_9BURK|nr:hypothetical protein [Pseudoduganella plicata]QBQ36755.1 hypothetical protein E1742_11690 [Pseudoduganella plicata]GGY73012.1 hypothetical protein GCM10007388_01320 [Pseudoduganella plicata]
MNESVHNQTKTDPRAPAKPLRSERMAARGVDLKKKHGRTGAVAAGGLLALVGLAAVLLGS